MGKDLILDYLLFWNKFAATHRTWINDLLEVSAIYLCTVSYSLQSFAFLLTRQISVKGKVTIHFLSTKPLKSSLSSLPKDHSEKVVMSIGVCPNLKSCSTRFLLWPNSKIHQDCQQWRQTLRVVIAFVCLLTRHLPLFFIHMEHTNGFLTAFVSRWAIGIFWLL